MIKIIRKSSNTNSLESEGVFGTVHFGDSELVTMERPWIPSMEHPAGMPSESCIPTGVYSLVKAHSPKYNRDMYYLVSEDNGVHLREEDRAEEWERWGCMFHSANWPYQLNGCIAVGSIKGIVGTKYGVSNSAMSTGSLYAYIDKMEDPRIIIEWD